MFTVEQIKAAHSEVKSGADFPKYVRAIKQLGVNAFETWVVDSHYILVKMVIRPNLNRCMKKWMSLTKVIKINSAII